MNTVLDTLAVIGMLSWIISETLSIRATRSTVKRLEALESKMEWIAEMHYGIPIQNHGKSEA